MQTTETALIIRPGDIALQDVNIILKEEWEQYAEDCMKVIVSDEDSYNKAQLLFAKTSLKLRATDNAQASFEKPIKDYLKAFRAKVETALYPMTKALAHLDRQLKDYRWTVEQARLKEQAHLQKLAENQRARDIAKGKTPTLPEAVAAVVLRMAKTTETEAGKVTARVIWKAERIKGKEHLIPKEYFMTEAVYKAIDTEVGAIARATKGAIQVPGYRIFSEESFAVRE